MTIDQAADYFALFGLERAHGLDRDAFERRYLELSRVVHPDRFSNASTGARREALEKSSALNTAYRTLRNPVSRAEYMVKLGGIDLDSSEPQTGAPSPGQGFLVEMVELRERLEDARGEGDEGVDDLRDEIEERADDVFEEAVDALARGKLEEAARGLVVHRYLRRFLEEVEADGDDDD